MKILASKVPAQVWAEKVKRSKYERVGLDEELVEKWERSKQVYRVDKEIWETAIVEDDTELPVSALTQMPFDCLFLQRKKVFTSADEFRFDGQSYRTEVTVRCNGFFAFMQNGSGSFPSDELVVVPLLDEDGSFTKTKRLSDSRNVYEIVDDSELGKEWYIPLEGGRTVGAVAGKVRDGMNDEAEGEAEGWRNDASFTEAFPDEEKLAEQVCLSICRAQKRHAGAMAKQVGSALGSLLYIISKGADVKTVYVPQKNRPKKTKQTDCTVHEVGFNVSRHLERVRYVYAQEEANAKHDGEGEKSEEGKPRRHVSPHVRRAHWHGYWLGKRDNPTDLVIKWIAPVIVNGGEGELSGTVHVVSGSEQG